jgi:rRNA maturation protein Nop10
MQDDTFRGLETPGTRDESTTISGACEKCGREVAGISASAPGRRTLEPCGHETGFLTAKQCMLRDIEPTSEEHSLRTDGRGAPLPYEKPTHRRDRANSHFCEAIGARVYCLEEECGHCGDEDGESR